MAKKNILLFSDTFNINDCDKDGKKFDRVSRFVGRGESLEMELIIDVNTDLYPLDIGDRVNVILTTSLALDPSQAQSEDMIIGATSAEEITQKTSWREKSSTERDLSDEFEYVMYGKVYKYDEERRSKVYPLNFLTYFLRILN
ncbi:RNA polymerase [Gigaspora margarita]|uniref:DNA-directed RNA polymerases I, II, and III subunit RPABC3 n=1 Tax=Gigaspora margarita TaxID=4874 RepID=A0A8H4ACC8_GIGMA|nr:RNA polymerase [Gigaspora margarita]